MGIQFCRKDKYNIDDLISIISILRDKDCGCPWDKEQTHKSIRNCMIEEAYEVIEAIDTDNRELMLEELGDVLLQVVFHSQIESETKGFEFGDVCNAISSKMINRHPHIFGDDKAKTSEEVLSNWDDIKQLEKSQKSYTDTLNGVSKSLPSLIRSQKLQKRASRAISDKWDTMECLNEIKSIIAKLEESIALDSNTTKGQIGSLLFATALLAQKLNLDAEECLYSANDGFIEGFSILEDYIKAHNKDISSLSKDELLYLYKLAVQENE